MKTTAMMLLTNLLICGCMSQAPTIKQETIEVVATYILREATYYSTLFSSCAALGGEVEIDAISKQQDWLNTNLELIAAADQYYSQQQAVNTFEYQGKTLAPAAIKLAIEEKKRAENELGLAQRTANNRIKTCSFRLGKMNGSNMSLTQHQTIADAQIELLKYSPLDRQNNNFPSLAGGITEIAPGPTYFQLIKAHESSCAEPYTLPIANQWPREAYAYFCGDTATEVLTCEWGNCQSKKL